MKKQKDSSLYFLAFLRFFNIARLNVVGMGGISMEATLEKVIQISGPKSQVY